MFEVGDKVIITSIVEMGGEQDKTYTPFIDKTGTINHIYNVTEDNDRVVIIFDGIEKRFFEEELAHCTDNCLECDHRFRCYTS